MDAILQAQLDQRRAEYLYRTRLNVASGCSSTLNIDGQTLVNFCSNDYLGLAAHPAISQALKQAADQFGTGSGASHLISGHSKIHDQIRAAARRVYRTTPCAFILHRLYGQYGCD